MGKPMGSGFTSIREARVPKVFLRIEKNRFPGDSPILRSQNGPFTFSRGAASGRTMAWAAPP
jgi:hypothetical protein